MKLKKISLFGFGTLPGQHFGGYEISEFLIVFICVAWKKYEKVIFSHESLFNQRSVWYLH